MKKALLLTLFIYQINFLYSQTSSPTCITSTPICEGTTNTFPSSIGVGSESGPSYGCLGTQPNPAWFYFKIDQPGNINFMIDQMDSAGIGRDVDFICWGPFTSPTAPCTAQLTSMKMKDCSYSTSETEFANIDSTLTGEYYIIMITNFSNLPANVTFSFLASSTGTLSCSETCITHPYYNSPLCVNGTLQLIATNHFGVGNYTWTGPNGFSSILQNPLINAVDGIATGNYVVNYIRDSTCNYTDSVWVNVDTCGTLTGNVFADANINCVKDSSENPKSNVQLRLSQTGTFVAWAWTDAFGYYYFDVPTGSYTLEVLPSVSNPVTCSSSMAHSVTVSAIISTENFAVDCNVIDMAATGLMVSGIPFFPGQTSAMYPLASSFGPDCNASPIPGQVIVILDTLVYYAGQVSGYPGPDTIISAPTGDTLKWNVADITSLFGTYYNFPFLFTTITSATIGDTVHVTLVILPITGDSDTSNNVYQRAFIVGNSYDPNSKEVSPTGYGPNGFIPATTTELEYTVNFQNTGTASAQNIYILDTLDTDVDITTLEFISSSHPVTITFLPGNILKFNFSNIMLPDSLHNESLSHGYVKYSIAPNPGLDPGDQITNTAYIYFDFNPPIVTNTAINTIEFPLGIKENRNYELKVFPNPANYSVTVSFEDKQSKMFNVKILNISGQVIYSGKEVTTNGKFSRTIDLSNISQGVYMLEINSDKQVVHQKIIKN